MPRARPSATITPDITVEEMAEACDQAAELYHASFRDSVARVTAARLRAAAALFRRPDSSPRADPAAPPAAERTRRSVKRDPTTAEVQQLAYAVDGAVALAYRTSDGNWTIGTEEMDALKRSLVPLRAIGTRTPAMNAATDGEGASDV